MKLNVFDVGLAACLGGVIGFCLAPPQQPTKTLVEENARLRQTVHLLISHDIQLRDEQETKTNQ